MRFCLFSYNSVMIMGLLSLLTKQCFFPRDYWTIKLITIQRVLL